MQMPENRRTFLQNGSLLLLGAGLASTSEASLLANDLQRQVRIGLVTDLHYADKPPARSRHYRETLEKLAEAAEQFSKDKPDFVVELGDLIDSARSLEAEKQNLTRINREFAALPGNKHYVLGNHCVHTLTKDEFLGVVGHKNAHYSFDAGGFSSPRPGPFWLLVSQLCLAAENNLSATDWPRWRGSNADNVADNRNLPVHWSRTEHVRWSVKLPGWGTRSPVVYWLVRPVGHSTASRHCAGT